MTDGLFKKLSLEQQSAALAFDGNPDFGPPMTDLTKALSELRRLKLGDEIDAEFVSTILDAARTGDLLPRADADLAVALMVEKAARLIISFPGGTVMHSPPQLLTEAHDAVMGLVPASALAELQALRDDVTGWISNAMVAREKWSENETHREAAEAELATLRAQVERLRAAAEPLGAWLSAALDDPKPCAEMKRDINAWFAALTEGAAP